MASITPVRGPGLAPVLLSLALAGLALPAQADQLNLSDPNDAVKARQKMICSLEEGKTIVYWWKGGAFSRIPGEKDRHLFNVEGMNIRHCKNFQHDERGHGFRSVSREVLFYLDPTTNEMLGSWTNPWTGEAVEVMHVANDPVNMRAPLYAYSAEGKPATFDATFVNGRVITSGEVPLFYKNPLAGDYQEYVGNMYHAMEATNFYAYEEELLDADKDTLDRMTLSWARFSEWLPWMKMGGRTGMMIFNTVGGRVASFEDLPERMKAEIRANYPEYDRPPPLDDARPNVTSWSYFKQIIDARRAEESGQGGSQ
jgi:hypothetical protein